VDDEIEFLRPHIAFLQERGYEVTPATNGSDALELIKRQIFDAVLLDEMMPGMDGLTTLAEIKGIMPGLPVIMITKNEEESLMEEAIGSQIDDYLTKPVNPSQILMALKKKTEGRKLSQERLSRDYVKDFSQINLAVLEGLNWREWIELHLRLSQWEKDLDRHPDAGLKQSLEGQRESCNAEFAKYIEKEYHRWVADIDAPLLSTDIAKMFVLPYLKQGRKVIFTVMDCMRLDQWMALEGLLGDIFNLKRDFYYAILPSATPYARNALFAGMFPLDIELEYPDLWQKGEEDESSSNRFERQLLDGLIASQGINLKPEAKYIKILDPEEGLRVEKRIDSYINIPLVSIVVNFVDMLAHSRSSSEVIKEIVPDEAAYRSVVRTWFEYSPLFGILKALAKQENTVVIMTSDHGSIRVQRGSKVISDKEASTNLRYKYGRNLKCDLKHALYIKEPAEYKLPQRGINTNYIIAKEGYYFIYPTNYNKYLSFFKNSFQHGGISLEEMILPVYTLTGK